MGQPIFASGHRIVVLLAVVLALSTIWVAGSVSAAEVAEAEIASKVPESVADLELLEKRVAAVVRRASGVTVSVQSGGGSGSGVIISEDGYVLTAGHVSVAPGRRVVFIFPDGKRAQGKTLGVNVGVDAGLMKITDEGPWPFVEMGDIDSVKTGSWVVAMGHPGGFDAERSVVSRLGRVIRVRDTVMQTDCTIIGGDSGGPLFDLDGKVIGIHSRISSSLRQNYHVPISIYKRGWDRMAEGEVWNRPVARGGGPRPGGPFIGVQGANRRADGEGAPLGRVYPDSPAEKAGLKAGDVIVEFDQSPVGSFGDLSALVGQLKPGDKAGLVVRRGKERVELEIVIGKAGS